MPLLPLMHCVYLFCSQFPASPCVSLACLCPCCYCALPPLLPSLLPVCLLFSLVLVFPLTTSPTQSFHPRWSNPRPEAVSSQGKGTGEKKKELPCPKVNGPSFPPEVSPLLPPRPAVPQARRRRCRHRQSPLLPHTTTKALNKQTCCPILRLHNSRHGPGAGEPLRWWLVSSARKRRPRSIIN